MKEIAFYEEKKWIMAYWYKRNRKCQLTQSSMQKQWKMWWKEDAFNITDEIFQDTFAWLKETVNALSMEEIKKERYKVSDKRPIPNWLQQRAISKGYFIKKVATSNHPYMVSGYMICSSKGKRHKKIVCGRKFNLTFDEVKEFLERQ